MATGSGAVGFIWDQSPDVMARNVGQRADELPDHVGDALERLAADVESWARSSHPWANVTGAAEEGLTAEAIRSGTVLTLVLYHTVPYGGPLELAHGGVWGVIAPTLQIFYPRVMAAMREVVS